MGKKVTVGTVSDLSVGQDSPHQEETLEATIILPDFDEMSDEEIDMYGAKADEDAKDAADRQTAYKARKSMKAAATVDDTLNEALTKLKDLTGYDEVHGLKGHQLINVLKQKADDIVAAVYGNSVRVVKKSKIITPATSGDHGIAHWPDKGFPEHGSVNIVEMFKTANATSVGKALHKKVINKNLFGEESNKTLGTVWTAPDSKGSPHKLKRDKYGITKVIPVDDDGNEQQTNTQDVKWYLKVSN